jgi:sodium transport system ATP-binding protein
MLEVRRLSKSFPVPRSRGGQRHDLDPRERVGLFHALLPLSFVAERGAIVGVLGPNGAGKTTLLRLLSTALRPSSGTALIDGHDVVRQPREVRRRLGFLSGTTGVYERLTPREVITYHGRLHGMQGAALERALGELLERLDMLAYADRRCLQLSAGMKQKVSIARTLVHDPDLVVLDEPTTGLDVAAARTILELISECKRRGKTVLLSTHRMSEVERLCDRIVVLHRGRACFEGTPGDLRGDMRCEHLDEAFLALLDRDDAGGNRHAA